MNLNLKTDSKVVLTTDSNNNIIENIGENNEYDTENTENDFPTLNNFFNENNKPKFLGVISSFFHSSSYMKFYLFLILFSILLFVYSVVIFFTKNGK